MEDVKKALSDNDIDLNRLEDWYNDRCWNLSVEWRTRDDYRIGLLVEGTQCTVVFWNECLCEWRVLFISTIYLNENNNNYYDQLLCEILENLPSASQNIFYYYILCITLYYNIMYYIIIYIIYIL